MQVFLKKVFRRPCITGIFIHNAIQCNFDCMYCYAKDRRLKKKSISVEGWMRLIREARDLGAKYVWIGGPGEPLLDPSTFELIDYSHRLGLISAIATNGSLITPSSAAFLWKRRTRFFLKLHSLDPQVYQVLCGRKSSVAWEYYEYYHKGKRKVTLIPSWLKVLLEDETLRNDPYQSSRIILEAVITKLNIHCIPAIAAFALENKMRFFFETLMGYPSLRPSREEHLALFGQLKKQFGRKFLAQQRNNTCRVVENPVIWEDGSMHLCLMKSTPVGGGNIEDTSLKELWVKRCALKKLLDVKRRRFPFTPPNCLGRESFFDTTKDFV